MVESALNTADPNGLEFIFRADLDDRTFPYPLRPETTHFNYTVILGASYGYNGIPRYLNHCAEVAKGEILGIVNDDLVFTRKGWADEVALSLAGDEIRLVGQEPFEFPFVPRRWYDTLGFLAPSDEVNVDSFILHVARGLLNRYTVLEPFIEHSPPNREGEELQERWDASAAFWSDEHTRWRTKAATRLASL